MSNQVTEIKGIEVIFDKIHKDDRGSIFKISQQVLDRFFKRDVGRDVIFCVNNLAGTVRGLHMQSKNHHEAKYIKCTQGVIQEFFLDLRDSSATFGKYMSINMNSRENLSVYVPPGIAHGYQTLEDNTITIRERDTMQQQRVAIADIEKIVRAKVDWKGAI